MHIHSLDKNATMDYQIGSPKKNINFVNLNDIRIVITRKVT